MVKKEERNNLVLILINKGMSYRRIGKLFNISHTVVKDINKKYNKDKLSNRTCVMCGRINGLIDNNHITICDNCEKDIKSY